MDHGYHLEGRGKLFEHNMAEIGDDSVELLKDDAQFDDEKNEPGIWTMNLLSH